MAASYKNVTQQACPEDIITMAAEELGTLADELNEWYENMPENLQNGDKASTIQDAVSTLSAMQQTLEAIEDFPHSSARVTYTTQQKTRKAKQPSRQVRFNNAQSMLEALRDFYSNLDTDEDDIINSLDEAIEEVEIPGPWG